VARWWVGLISSRLFGARDRLEGGGGWVGACQVVGCCEGRDGRVGGRRRAGSSRCVGRRRRAVGRSGRRRASCRAGETFWKVEGEWRGCRGERLVRRAHKEAEGRSRACGAVRGGWLVRPGGRGPEWSGARVRPLEVGQCRGARAVWRVRDGIGW